MHGERDSSSTLNPQITIPGARGVFQEGTLLHQVEGSVGEWVGARENSPDIRIKCYGSWERERG